MFSRMIAVALAFMLVLGTVGTAFAIDDIGFGAGTMVFMEKGKETKFGYTIKGRFPWGINKKQLTPVGDSMLAIVDNDLVTIPIYDTTITFEVVTEAMTVYSEFKYKDYQEAEAEVAVTKLRKTLGFFGTSLEGGLTVWHFRATSDSELNNTVVDGYYVGLHVKPFHDWEVTAGAHAIPMSDVNDTYAIQLGITLIL